MSATRRAILFANGERMHAPTVRGLVRPGDWVAAADGGLRWARALGLWPDLLIGDLDSAPAERVEEARAAGTEVRQYPVHKDETDLELAIEGAAEQGFEEIYVVGALGGRLDMTLGNLFLLLLPSLEGRRARLDDGYEEVFLVRPGAPGQLEGSAGERVSLLPLNGPAAGIRTEGLEYPLRGEGLRPERTRGISNVMTGARASVTLESGLLVCIHTRAAGLAEEEKREEERR